jgi:hypothetical protein
MKHVDELSAKDEIIRCAEIRASDIESVTITERTASMGKST